MVIGKSKKEVQSAGKKDVKIVKENFNRIFDNKLPQESFDIFFYIFFSKE